MEFKRFVIRVFNGEGALRNILVDEKSAGSFLGVTAGQHFELAGVGAAQAQLLQQGDHLAIRVNGETVYTLQNFFTAIPDASLDMVQISENPAQADAATYTPPASGGGEGLHQPVSIVEVLGYSLPQQFDSNVRYWGSDADIKVSGFSFGLTHPLPMMESEEPGHGAATASDSVGSSPSPTTTTTPEAATTTATASAAATSGVESNSPPVFLNVTAEAAAGGVAVASERYVAGDQASDFSFQVYESATQARFIEFPIDTHMTQEAGIGPGGVASRYLVLFHPDGPGSPLSSRMVSYFNPEPHLGNIAVSDPDGDPVLVSWGNGGTAGLYEDYGDGSEQFVFSPVTMESPWTGEDSETLYGVLGVGDYSEFDNGENVFNVFSSAFNLTDLYLNGAYDFDALAPTFGVSGHFSFELAVTDYSDTTYATPLHMVTVPVTLDVMDVNESPYFTGHETSSSDFTFLFNDYNIGPDGEITPGPSAEPWKPWANAGDGYLSVDGWTQVGSVAAVDPDVLDGNPWFGFVQDDLGTAGYYYTDDTVGWRPYMGAESSDGIFRITQDGEIFMTPDLFEGLEAAYGESITASDEALADNYVHGDAALTPIFPDHDEVIIQSFDLSGFSGVDWEWGEVSIQTAQGDTFTFDLYADSDDGLFTYHLPNLAIEHITFTAFEWPDELGGDDDYYVEQIDYLAAPYWFDQQIAVNDGVDATAEFNTDGALEGGVYQGDRIYSELWDAANTRIHVNNQAPEFVDEGNTPLADGETYGFTLWETTDDQAYEGAQSWNLAAMDPDGDAVRYWIVDADDPYLFSLDQDSGVLSWLGGDVNYEAEIEGGPLHYEIDVVAADSWGAYDLVTVEVDIKDVNERPDVSSAYIHDYVGGGADWDADDFFGVWMFDNATTDDSLSNPLIPAGYDSHFVRSDLDTTWDFEASLYTRDPDNPGLSGDSHSYSFSNEGSGADEVFYSYSEDGYFRINRTDGDITATDDFRDLVSDSAAGDEFNGAYELQVLETTGNADQRDPSGVGDYSDLSDTFGFSVVYQNQGDANPVAGEWPADAAQDVGQVDDASPYQDYLITDVAGGGAGSAYLVFGNGLLDEAADWDLDTGAVYDGEGDQLGFVDVLEITGNDAGDLFGYSAAFAGDFNGGGANDIIIGAPGHDNDQGTADAADDAADAGAAYVIYGEDLPDLFPVSSHHVTVSIDSLNTLSGLQGLVIEGQQADGYLGYSVDGAGLVNGDGPDDVVIGAPGEDGQGGLSQAGAAYLLYGSDEAPEEIELPSLVNGDPLTAGDAGFELEGNAAGQHLGTEVTGLADINGGGSNDFVVNADPNPDFNDQIEGESDTPAAPEAIDTFLVVVEDIAPQVSDGYELAA